MPPRQIALRVHLWLGIVIAIVIFIEGLSGAVLAFRRQLSGLLAPVPRVVVTTQGPVLPYAALISKLEAAYPGHRLRSLFPRAPSVGTQQPWLAYMTTLWRWGDVSVAFDPHTGSVLYDSNITYRGWQGRLGHLCVWMSGLHVRTLEGTGIGCVAVALLIVSISGLFLWWPYWLFWPKMPRNFDFHATAGFYSSLLVALFAFTTIAMVWPGLFSPQQRPVPNSPVQSSAADSTGLPPTIEEMVNIAVAAVPGGHLQQIAPGMNGHRFNVGVVSSRQYTNVSLNPETGRILDIERPPAPSRGQSFVDLMRRIHTARGYGLTGQILAGLAGLAMAFLAVTGPLVWWSRGRSGRRQQAA